MMINPSDKDQPDSNSMRKLMGPGQIDQLVRQAIQMCWMILPDGKKTAAQLEVEFRRIVDRALRDLHDDEKAFT